MVFLFSSNHFTERKRGRERVGVHTQEYNGNHLSCSCDGSWGVHGERRSVSRSELIKAIYKLTQGTWKGCKLLPFHRDRADRWLCKERTKWKNRWREIHHAPSGELGSGYSCTSLTETCNWRSSESELVNRVKCRWDDLSTLKPSLRARVSNEASPCRSCHSSQERERAPEKERTRWLDGQTVTFLKWKRSVNRMHRGVSTYIARRVKTHCRGAEWNVHHTCDTHWEWGEREKLDGIEGWGEKWRKKGKESSKNDRSSMNKADACTFNGKCCRVNWRERKVKWQVEHLNYIWEGGRVASHIFVVFHTQVAHWLVTSEW